jgi:hypothetical protein
MNEKDYCFFRPPASTGLMTGQLVSADQTVRSFSIPFEVKKVGIQVEIDSL